MKNIDTTYYQSKDGQNVKRILVDAYCMLIDDLLRTRRFKQVIQMGWGDGDVVRRIQNRVSSVDVIEGDEGLCQQAGQVFNSNPKITIIQSLFEDYQPTGQNLVDLVLGNHVLEHVDDPVLVLKKTRTWLKKDGTALFTVPNATSLHRRIGVRMGLLKTIYDLNEQDRRVGHQRVYDAISFQKDLAKSGYKIQKFGGFNLKLVSHKQMRDWPDELLKAIYEVSLECPAGICSNLYAICRT